MCCLVKNTLITGVKKLRVNFNKGVDKNEKK